MGIIISSQIDTPEYCVHFELQRQLQSKEKFQIALQGRENFDGQDMIDPFLGLVVHPCGFVLHLISNSNFEAGLSPIVDNQNIQGMEIDNAFSERRSGWLEARSSRMMVPRVITAGTILYLRLMNQGLEHRCSSCVALHFITAKVKTSSIARPRFQTCFKDGQVVLDLILDPIKY